MAFGLKFNIGGIKVKLFKNLILVVAVSLMATGSALAAVDMATANLSSLSFDVPGGFMVAGMLVNKQAINSIFVGLKTIFNNALKAQTGNWQKTAMQVQSSSREEDYAWLSRFPAMKKWVGEKTIKSIKANKYTVVNDDYETTVEVDRNDIEDDRLGIYNTQSQMAGDSAAELPDTIIDELKNGGFAQMCMDGQYFYDIDHPVGDGSYSNKGIAALSSATEAAAEASLGVAITAISSFKDEEKKPLRLMPNVLEVPPALRSIAHKLVNADKLNNNSPNPFKGMLELVVNPALSSSTAWFVHCTNKPVKPFILQMRKAPVFVSQTDMNSDDVFMSKKYKFGVEARAAGVYGFPQTSYGSTGQG